MSAVLHDIVFFMRGLFFLLLTTSFLFSVPVEKATKYHELLLEDPDSTTLMERFLEAWFDEQDQETLEKWLEREALAEVKLGGVSARRVFARYLDHVGLHERALEQYESVLEFELSDIETELIRRHQIELLKQGGDYAGALAEVEQWKVFSPGEVLAWRKRAGLLVLLGRQKEAADELMRARNVFGRDDVELTRALAELQLPLGRHREGLRLYEHLFRVAKTDEERLRYIDEMYAVASQAGSQQEMIERFQREHTQAKRDLFPLRVLAQLYKLSRNSGAQQEVLLKLHRLLPNDEKILFELVELATVNGDDIGARHLLLEHAARTRSAGTLRRLATMQFNAGEVDAGLKVLSKIAPSDLTAGDVESTVLQLWKLKEHQLVKSAIKVLTKSVKNRLSQSRRKVSQPYGSINKISCES